MKRNAECLHSSFILIFCLFRYLAFFNNLKSNNCFRSVKRHHFWKIITPRLHNWSLLCLWTAAVFKGTVIECYSIQGFQPATSRLHTCFSKNACCPQQEDRRGSRLASSQRNSLAPPCGHFSNNHWFLASELRALLSFISPWFLYLALLLASKSVPPPTREGAEEKGEDLRREEAKQHFSVMPIKMTVSIAASAQGSFFC